MSEQPTSGTADIRVDFPDEASPRLQLAIGPAKLSISPGEATPWVAGTYRDPQGNMPHRVETRGSTTRITHERHVNVLWKGQPEFDLQLGSERAYSLSIDSGATEAGPCDLGGLPLTDFAVKLGAGRFALDFSKANPEVMSRFSLVAGAADVTALHLANANTRDISIDGGAANMTLDFGGELQRETHARIRAGAAVLDLTVPSTTAAKISIQTVLGNQKIGDGFTTREGALWTPAAVDGGTPVLFIDVTGALGEIRIRLTPDSDAPQSNA